MKITDILTEQEIAEMNRRDFLKGIGAGAIAGVTGAGTLGYKAGQNSIPDAKKKYFNPKLWFLCGYMFEDFMPSEFANEECRSIASEVNGILRDTPQWDEYVRVNQEGNKKLWEDLNEVRERLGLPPFKQEPLGKNIELFRPWLVKRMTGVHAEMKKLVGWV